MTDETSEHQKLVIVTGLSGAGMSTTLKHLEDMGYEVFDNFPLTLLANLISSPDSDGKPIAVGIDSRTRGFGQDRILGAAELYKAKLVFLTADENALLKRFTETRRRHPLAKDRPASAGIKYEQERLYELRQQADIVVDTTHLSVHDLRHILEGHFQQKSKHRMTVSIISFGFRNGTPRESDIVMDVRFLKNPNWDPDLKPLRGTDKAVGDYIEKDEHFATFFKNFQNLIEPLLPRYDHEGKNYLTISIGCTGGHHRSVFTAEKLTKWIEDKGYPAHVLHRDISR